VDFAHLQLEPLSCVVFFIFFNILWLKGKNNETPKALRSDRRPWLRTLLLGLVE